MSTLEELLKIDGVIAAGDFSADGKMVNTLAGSFTQLSKMKFIPQHGLGLLRWRLDSGSWRQSRRFRRNI